MPMLFPCVNPQGVKPCSTPLIRRHPTIGEMRSMVLATGFEPVTSCVSSRRSTRLSVSEQDCWRNPQEGAVHNPFTLQLRAHGGNRTPASRFIAGVLATGLRRRHSDDQLAMPGLGVHGDQPVISSSLVVPDGFEPPSPGLQPDATPSQLQDHASTFPS